MRYMPVLLMALPLAAQSGNDFFETRIRPVLAERCYPCHSAKAPALMAGLRLDTKAGLAKAASGRLLSALSYTNPDLRMPPQGRLPAEIIDAFRQWVALGAPDPRQDVESPAPSSTIDVDRGRRFWSFRPVVKPTVPQVRDSRWPAGPVDHFVLAKLEQNNLRPAAPASRHDWLRRVTFDLTGLPPSESELDDFLADSSSNAHERVVDRLLQSPHYGERWARHWLDLVRFAETNGHEFDNDKLDAWRYRDYVIRAFQQDIPYDQFVREHIAGDLIPNPRRSLDGSFFESPLATGFFWFGEVLNSATDSVKSRADTVDNQIDVLGKTFLGLTIACARCHDHKFDPIPTRDYYALAGILHSTYVREAVVDTPEQAAGIQRASPPSPPTPAGGAAIRLRQGDQIFEDFRSYQSWYSTGAGFGPQPRSETASSFGNPQWQGSLTSRKFRMPRLWVHVLIQGTKSEARLKENARLRVTVVADDHKSEHITATGNPGWEWRSSRMTKEIGRECYFEIVDRDPAGEIAVDAIVLSDHDKPPEFEPPASAALPAAAVPSTPLPSSVWGLISQDEAPNNVRLHIRGSHKNLGEEVPRGMLQILPGAEKPITRGSGRLELAEWLSSPRNPLTSRVMVNRIWRHHFGRGLARTTENFGLTGDRPTHPELLDFLAATFVDSGWSIRKLHRLILLSSAYRMSSLSSPDAVEKDANNGLFHHFPVRRLEGEAIRDSILAVSGSLDRTLYGPGITPHISKYQDGRGKPLPGPLDGNRRRSLYIQVRRNFITPMFLAFDYPLPVSTIGSRGTSTVPSQALIMLNNEFVAAQAALWARRMESEEPDPDRRLNRMFLQAYSRRPEDWERKDTLAFAAGTSWTDLAHVLLNSAEFVYVR